MSVKIVACGNLYITKILGLKRTVTYICYTPFVWKDLKWVLTQNKIAVTKIVHRLWKILS